MLRQLFILLGLVVIPLAHADDAAWSGNVNLLFGAKSLDESYWYPVEDQGEFGVMVDFKRREWPISVALDILASAMDDISTGLYIEGATSELDFGIRKIFELSGSTVHPFIGGGLALIGAERTTWIGPAAFPERDTGAGIWLNGGVYVTLSEAFNLGFQIRISGAEVTLGNSQVNGGGGHSGLMVGYHW